jgi:DDE_Tnp_1-associated
VNYPQATVLNTDRGPSGVHRRPGSQGVGKVILDGGLGDTPVILGLALCAVVAGARSFTAIAEWAADADQQTLNALGVTGRVPSESTFGNGLRDHIIDRHPGQPRRARGYVPRPLADRRPAALGPGHGLG